MDTIVFCNGELLISKKTARRTCSKANFLIAADGGANHLKNLNLKPDVIIGDMDSVNVKSFIKNKSIEKIFFKPDKDQTDTELAIIEALKRKSKKITLIGATGGRLDHTLANIELIKKYPGKVILIENNSKLISINKKQKLIIKGKKDSIISILPAVGNPKIKITGLKYELNNEKLKFPTQGTSNLIETRPAQITIDSGLLLVCTELKTKFEVTQSLEVTQSIEVEKL